MSPSRSLTRKAQRRSNFLKYGDHTMAGSVGSEDGDVGFQIAPMVDVVFVLMLFFMASAGMQVVERELGINLPSGGRAVSNGPPPTPVIIDISADGQVGMN